ncbi:MAG: hypothetical protein CL561_12115 [Alphaproteobacteria bacterium]|nr:hypothetical protein [Alphaproteobacteria bacterium]
MKLSIKHFKFLAFFLMKTFLFTSFNGAAMAAEYDLNVIKPAADSEWHQSLTLADKARDKESKRLALWMYAVSDNKKLQQDSKVTWRDLVDVIEARPYWPSQMQMKTALEGKMPFDPPRDFDAVDWFDLHSPETARGMKIYLSALEDARDYTKIKAKLSEWWPTMMVRPEDQVYFLKRYHRYIEEDWHVKRLSNLIDRSHYTNARRISEILGEDYERLAEARIKLNRDMAKDSTYTDGQVSYAVHLVPDALKSDVGLTYDRLQWRRKKDLDAGANDILFAPPSADNIKGEEGRWWRERHIMIRRMLEDGKYDTAYKLAAGHQQSYGVNYSEAEWMAGWIALRFQDAPSKALKHFYAMKAVVKTPISLSRHYYWLGRSFDALGDKENARANYAEAAALPTTYYGQLAARASGQEPSFSEIKAPLISEELRLSLSSHENLSDLFNAARVLQRVDYTNSSTQFYVSAADIASKFDLGAYYVAQKAAQDGKINVSVLLARKAAMQHIYYAQNYAYPVLDTDVYDYKIPPSSLSPLFVHGLIRQESLFDNNAKSAVGARGLMQLMPATARQTARELGIQYNINWLQDRPEYNIALGSAYAESVIRQFDNAYPLAIAAYNAGPHRVQSWLRTYGDPRRNEIDWIDWIELIPFSETRNYVMRVMEGYGVYSFMLNDTGLTLAGHEGLRNGLYP